MLRTAMTSLVVMILASSAWAATCPVTAVLALNRFLKPDGSMVQRANGNLVITNGQNDNLNEFTESGAFYTSIGADTWAAIVLLHPTGVAVDHDGRLYVTDQGHGFIVKNPTLPTETRWGAGSSPANLAFSPDGTVLYVTRLTGNSVGMYSTSGAPLGSFGSPGSGAGQFDTPFGIATDAGGNVYVADQGNHRIQVFSPTGTYLSQFGSFGSAPGQLNHPAGINFDASGNLYVADRDNHRIQVFSSLGAPLCEFGGFGTQLGQLKSPAWAYPARDGSVLVGDANNFRVVSYLPSATPAQTSSWGAIKMLYR